MPIFVYRILSLELVLREDLPQEDLSLWFNGHCHVVSLAWDNMPAIATKRNVFLISDAKASESAGSVLHYGDRLRDTFTGGKGILTQQAHGEFIVSSETIVPAQYPVGPW